MRVRFLGVLLATAACAVSFVPNSSWAGSFTNFESPPQHPLDLSPDGQTLAVTSLPDARVELFDLSSGMPLLSGDVRVGIDPVSARFRNDNELWVANFISNSVSVIDLSSRRVIATIQTSEGPSDIAFANQRAFVSCAGANRILVVDVTTRLVESEIPIKGDRPKSMALNLDGSRLYVAIFESGNASTILAPPLVPLDQALPSGPVDDPSGPYEGINPPPNKGLEFDPPINPDLGTEMRPRVSHIVKRNGAGRWMDDNERDWTEFVSGSQSHLSGRPQGWDMPDRDLAVIDTSDFSVSYVSGLMNICMATAVNPTTGMIAVVGTDATNERRFEPNLKGTFLRVNLALIDPDTLETTIGDLNPHLDYASPTIPLAERQESIGDPRGIAWSTDGARGYLIGMGSRNLVAIDGQGLRLAMSPVELPEGPAGIALDENRDQLYVFSRFASSLSVVSTVTHTVIGTLPMHDSTPQEIRAGRKHLYDTRLHSGLGHVSCASCHVDARFDRLAWDLGDPSASIIPPPQHLVFNGFSPMKGPMVTQTFQDSVRFGTLHWRGDRPDLEAFNITFPDLLGADSTLSDAEMQDFKNFLSTIHFPPNPTRNLDNSLPRKLPLPGHRGFETEENPTGRPLPDGDATEGFEIFKQNCITCHNGDAGLIGDSSLNFLGRSGGLPFKSAQLRSLRDKIGMDMATTESRAGFGFLHDGSVDTLSNFLLHGFEDFFFDLHEVDRGLADTIAFLLSFSGSEIRTGQDGDHESQDAHAAIGRQVTLTSDAPNPLLDEIFALLDNPEEAIELVAHGRQDGVDRGWFYHRVAGIFQSDRNTEIRDSLTDLASLESPVTFTVVPVGSAIRLGVDRDEDGYYDRTELDLGTDPADVQSLGVNRAPILNTPLPKLSVHRGLTLRYQIEAVDPDVPIQSLTYALAGAVPEGMSIDVSGLIEWTPPPTHSLQQPSKILVTATDDGIPRLTGSTVIIVEVWPEFQILPLTFNTTGRAIVRWQGAPGHNYQVEIIDFPNFPQWLPISGSLRGFSAGTNFFRDNTWPLPPERLYRVRLLDE